MEHDPDETVQYPHAAITVREQLGLNKVKQSIDEQRDDRYQQQDQEHMLAGPASLRDIDKVAQAPGLATKLHHFGQHDVTEGQPED
jgi:hypothetical protein